jgi:hypothetical protein
MGRTTVEYSTSSDNDLPRKSRNGKRHPSTRKTDDSNWITIATRHPSNVPRGRVNQQGWDMWDTVMKQVKVDEEVRETVKLARGEDAQRAHCAALTRLVRVCAHLSLSWEKLRNVEALQALLAKVLDWSGRHGATANDLKRMKTAISVLYNYRFKTEMSDNPIMQSVVRKHVRDDPPVRAPLRLNWELPQLLMYIEQMGENRELTQTVLIRKCVALVMATTCARFTEMEQFSLSGSDPTEDNSRWSFNVRVKNREYLQPIVLHSMHHQAIDPIRAMSELRERVSKVKEELGMQSDTFWCDVRGNVLSIEQIRHAAQHLLLDAGIRDTRAYHIKHATISWLHKQGVPAAQIIRFIRHALGSTTYMEYYLSDDLGEKCTSIIEDTTMLEDTRSTIRASDKERDIGDAWESNPFAAIASTIETAVSSSTPILRPSEQHLSSSQGNGLQITGIF